MTESTSRAREETLEQTRARAMNLAAQGRYDEARALLRSLLASDATPNFEVLSDIATIALRAGDLVQSIGLARHVLAAAPDHDVARITLAMGLASIGSYAEALALFDMLHSGAFSERVKRTDPDLSAVAASEAARLRARLEPADVPAPPHKYDFSHLTQELDQRAGGPIQDDEALLLYSVVRTMRLKRVLEVGGLEGYSARNFLRALSWDEDTAVYTVDLEQVTSQAANHFTIQKDAGLLEPADVHDKPLDLVFFDCHVYDAQMDLYVRFANRGLITDQTVIALHDTNLHPSKFAPWAYALRDADGVCGYVHQDVERKMVNVLQREFGYDAFCAHTDVRRNDARLPYRHGVTLMKKFVELKT
jgi:predicted O-methyltransferase YrrM